MNKKSQVSIEYIIIVGFVTFILLSVLGAAFFYSGGIKDRIKMTQVSNFGNKIVSSAESVFYYGEPSKATITTYLPEGVQSIVVSDTDDSLVISVQLDSGLTVTSFSSNVPISGTLASFQGIRKINMIAGVNEVIIADVS